MENIVLLLIIGSILLIILIIMQMKRLNKVTGLEYRLEEWGHTAKGYSMVAINCCYLSEEKSLMTNKGIITQRDIEMITHVENNLLDLKQKKLQVDEAISVLQKMIWSLTYQFADKICREDENIVSNDLDESARIFGESFKNEYFSIINNNMKADVTTLDRHKVAAITAISIVKANPLTMKNNTNTKSKFVGNESLAINVALSYMLSDLNILLQQNNVERVEQYIMPEAWSCDTEYAMVLIRDLFYTKESKSYNALTLANNFFLLEYITLLSKGVNLEILKQKE